jgi:DNA-binding NtrC family response regulator
VWCDAHTQAVACRDHGVPIVLVGEPGVGKFALARSLFAEQLRTDRFSVFDAALQPIDGAAAWVTAVHHALADLDRVVVIRHLDLLEASAAHALCGLLDAGVARAQMVATSTEGLDAEPAHRPLMNRLAIAPIWVPPLRDHLGDLPDLLAALTRKHADGQRELRWLPDAVQTLTRLDWPTNIGQLENLVRRVLITCRNAYVSGNELPEDVRSRAPRRRLSHMERLELDAIMASLRQTSGNKSAAADLLGISRATLYRKVRRFGVDLEKSAF